MCSRGTVMPCWSRVSTGTWAAALSLCADAIFLIITHQINTSIHIIFWRHLNTAYSYRRHIDILTDLFYSVIVTGFFKSECYWW